MNASSPLLLLLVASAASDWSAAARKQEAAPDDVGARIRGLWKVHMKETLLKGKGWMRLFAVQRGVVGVQGVQSGLFLCLKEDGSAYGAERFSDDCLLKETLEENHYTTFSSQTHPGVFLALNHKGGLKRGTTVGRHQVHTHFLPRRVP